MSKMLELPEGTYKCTKIKAVDTTSNFIVEGQKVIGEYAPVIVVGKRFMAEGSRLDDYISTSLVKDFKMLPNNKVEIQTEYSVYLLEELFPPFKITDLL